VGASVIVQRGLRTPHRTEFRKLLYRFHSWSGFPLAIYTAIGKPDRVAFRCDIVGSDLDRSLENSSVDRSECAKVRLATDPHPEMSALAALASLLWNVVHDPPVVILNVSDCLSRDPDWGEGHANSEQAGAPSRAASNRFVRRRSPDACLIRVADGDTGSTHEPDYEANPRSRR
jgi:hypothetical protein